ncbi:MAG: histidine phosphatase family protein [Erysipelotrichaceae bacterium]|nr:histidine phosphatase family protein [Erysipelotrichaceae bacterium]
MRLIVIRHGETYANTINRQKIAMYIGAMNTELTNLTDNGILQAKKLFSDSDVKTISTMYCSDLKRSYDTAILIRPDLKPVIVPELRERSYGVFEGRYFEDVEREYKDYLNGKPAGVFCSDFNEKALGGESYSDVCRRIDSFLSSLNFAKDDTIGIVTHGHVIRCIFYKLLDIRPKERILQMRTGNCIPYIFEGKSRQGIRLISHDIDCLLNDKWF